MSQTVNQKDYKGVVEDMKNKVSQATTHRLNWENLAYVCDNYYKRSLDNSPATSNLGKIPTKAIGKDQPVFIAKIKKITRGIKNMLLKNQPRWSVEVGGMLSAPSNDEILVAQKILDLYYKKKYVRAGLPDVVIDGLVKSVGWAGIFWDEAKGEVQITFEAPDNIYTSPDGRFEGPTFKGSYMIRRYVRSLEEIKHNPLYTEGKFSDDVARLTPTKGQSPGLFNRLTGNLSVYSNTDGVVLVEEMYFFDSVDEPIPMDEALNAIVENKPMPEPEKKRKMRVITKIDSVAVRDDFLDYKEYPWIGYKPEHDHGQVYTRPWISDLIPLADAINRGWTNRDQWITNVARGRLLMKKDTKLSKLNNAYGIDIVQYTGEAPTEMRVENMPPIVDNHINEAGALMEDIGGIHGVSMGKNIGANYSGTAIASLQAADLDNISDPKTNLEMFFEELAYRILECESEYGTIRKFKNEAGQEITAMGKRGIEAMMEGIDPDLAKEKMQNTIVIRPYDNIEVDIIPGSAFTDLLAIDNLTKMKELGLKVPDSAIMEAMKIGNARELINRAMEEEEMSQEFKDGPDALEAKQAELENMKLLQGVNVAAQQVENHEIHMALHGKALQALDPQDPRADIIRKHILQHESIGNPQAQLPGESEIPVGPVGPGAADVPPAPPADGTQNMNNPPIEAPVAA